MICGRWSHTLAMRWSWVRALVVAVGGPKELLDPCGPWTEHKEWKVENVSRRPNGAPIEDTRRITAKVIVLRCEKCGALMEQRFTV